MSQRRWSEAEYLAGLQCDLRIWRAARPGPVPAPVAHASAYAARGVLRRRLAADLAPSRDWGGAEVELGELEAWIRGGAGAGVDAWCNLRLVAPDAAVHLDALVRGRGGAREISQPESRSQGSTQVRPLLELCVLHTARSVREEDSDRAAFQAWWLERAFGFAAVSVCFVGPDPRYTPGGDVAFWRRRDATRDVALLKADVGSQLARMASLVAGAEPEVEPTAHCRRPEPCPFLSRCESSLAADALYHCPRLGRASVLDLAQRGVTRIQDIPDGVRLSSLQKRARTAHREGRTVLEPGLAAALDPLGPPAYYLDFEYLSPPVPWLEGMRPFAPLPLQWSLHSIDRAGARAHRELLVEPDGGDPRRPVAERLLAAVGTDPLPVVVYSTAEADILAALAQALPDLEAPLRALRERLVDLQAIVQEHVYARAFRGSFSLKRVAEALVRPEPYADLGEVVDGASAAAALWELWCETPTRERRERLRADLLAYCARDTRALLEIHEQLRKPSADRSEALA